MAENAKVNLCYEGDSSYLFISYCHEDGEKALQIIRTLTAHGYRIWYDDGIKGGGDWFNCMSDEIEKCEVFVALYSKAYSESEYCKYEMLYAKRCGKTRLYINCDGAEEIPLMKDCFADNHSYPAKIQKKKRCERTAAEICDILMKNNDLLCTRRSYVFISYKNKTECVNTRSNLRHALEERDIFYWDYDNPNAGFNGEFNKDAKWFTVVNECACFVFVATKESLSMKEHTFFKLLIALRNSDIPKVIIGVDTDRRNPALKNILSCFPEKNVFFYKSTALDKAVDRIETEMKKTLRITAVGSDGKHSK